MYADANRERGEVQSAKFDGKGEALPITIHRMRIDRMTVSKCINVILRLKCQEEGGKRVKRVRRSSFGAARIERQISILFEDKHY